MNLLIALVAGSVVGWLAGSLINTNAPQSTLADMLAGAVSALVIAFFFSFSAQSVTGMSRDFDLSSLAFSILGALIFLVAFGVLRRSRNTWSNQKHT